MTHFSDRQYVGGAATGITNISTTVNDRNGGYGVPCGQIYPVYQITPTANVTTAVATAQAVAAAGNLTIDGTLASGGVATFDVPRGVQLVSTGAGDTTQTATVYGTDTYGVTLHETVSLNGTSVVTSKKAFKTITRVAISVACAGNISCGTYHNFGLPYALKTSGHLMRYNFTSAGAITADTGTVLVADATSPATATTGDVRGTYTPGSAPDASKVLTLIIAVPNEMSGGGQTIVGTLGVTQV